MGKDSQDKSPAEENQDSQNSQDSLKKEKPSFTQNNRLKVLSEKQIAAYNIPKEKLWYIQFKGESWGPFHRDDLRRFLDDDPHFPRDTKVASYLDKKWQPLFKIAEFQRRRAHPHKQSEVMMSNDFFLLKNGQKNGPYTLSVLLEKLKQKEILFNDLASIDNGETWIKIFEHPHFDRRSRAQEESPALPQVPHEQTFKKAEKEVTQLIDLTKLNLSNQTEDEKEGLLGLAYLGKMKVKNNTAPVFEEESLTLQQSTEALLQKLSLKLKFKKIMVYSFSFVFTVVTSFYIYQKGYFSNTPTDQSQLADENSLINSNDPNDYTSVEKLAERRKNRLLKRQQQNRMPASTNPSASPSPFRFQRNRNANANSDHESRAPRRYGRNKNGQRNMNGSENNAYSERDQDYSRDVASDDDYGADDPQEAENTYEAEPTEVNDLTVESVNNQKTSAPGNSPTKKRDDEDFQFGKLPRRNNQGNSDQGGDLFELPAQ